MNLRNLRQRLLFALWAAPLGWLVVNFNRTLVPPEVARELFGIPSVEVLPGHFLVVALIFLAAYEYLTMLAARMKPNGFWLVYIWLAVQSIQHLLPEDALGVLDAFERFDIYMLLLIVAAESAIWGRQSSRWKRASLLFTGVVFLSYAGYSLMNLYREPFETVFLPKDSLLVAHMGIVTVLAAAFLCDTAAYFAGNLWGKHHFSSISPRKTVEGAVAGLVTAIVVCTVGWHFFAAPAYPLYLGIAMGILVGLAGQAGDLLVSLMKRYYQVKDASNIIPGHGGILDRFDSVFFIAPILNLYFILVVRLYT